MEKSKEIFNNCAKKNMIKWNIESFKITHRRLYKSIIESINEALKGKK